VEGYIKLRLQCSLAWHHINLCRSIHVLEEFDS